MATRTPRRTRRSVRAMSNRPNRFKQVQKRIRREKEGKLPLFWYGGRDILTKENWKALIDRYNPKDLMETMDKIEEKARLKGSGVPIPETYMIVETEEDLERFQMWVHGSNGSFVIKPAKGHGGAGILVVNKRVAKRYILTSGKGVEDGYLIRHAKRIIDGIYTKKEPDRALVEERLVISRKLRELQTPGLLDIRIVAFKGFPIMAMTRLPTKMSGGKANIHQGAIGAGISISEGRIISATYLRKNIKRHPTSGKALIGFKFNMWEDILEVAAEAAGSMGLGFVGVDLTLAEGRGVVVLEVNKRPGLEIQNANGAGMKRRIKWVQSFVRKNRIDHTVMGPGLKAELSRTWDAAGWKKVPPVGGTEEE
ncbi:MAG: sugar-transfer associated ATP-grasp domain-containing protein [Thermoplasmatota archaeon]